MNAASLPSRWPATLPPLVLGVLSALVLVIAGPWVMVAVLVGLWAVVQILLRPLRGLLAFCVIGPVIPYTTVNLGIRVTISEALLALTWAGILLQWLQGRIRLPRPGQAERWVGWLVLWSFVPLVVGHYTVNHDGPSFINWARWLLNLSFLLLLPLLLRTAADRERLIRSLMIGFALMLLLSLGMFIRTPDARAMIPVLEALRYAHAAAVQDIFSANYVRMASPWVHPNSTGAILLMVVPLATFHAMGQVGWRRLLPLFVAVAGTAGIVFSGSRAAMLCLLVLWLWLARRRAPTAGRTLVMGLFIGSLLLMFYEPAQERLMSLFGGDDASSSIRLEEYRSFHLAVERFPLGLGFRLDPSPGFDGLMGISNYWLNYWYKLGLPGMLLVLMAQVAWWREVRPTGSLHHRDPARMLAIGATGALVAALLSGLLDHTLSFGPVLQGFFWLFLALSLHLVRHRDLPTSS